ncbi:MAG: NADH:flavin oxidoreductase [Deltaproteobacteria bacterium]|nr:NADH:flavin oxidoreductase [Deltaproteobacteria bacterium]
MEELFDPITLRGMKLPNRIVRSATSERAADEQGRVTLDVRELYKKLAQGGSGLVITGYTFIKEDGRCNPRQLGLSDDYHIEGMKALVKDFHASSGNGSKFCVQLVHGGRQVPPDTKNPVAPSAVKEPVLGTEPRELFPEEIEELVLDFAEAARRARDAGFDAVQIHAAHGYLVSQFLSPYTNKRDDDWGGDPMRRARFLTEIIDRTRHEVGDIPILVKLNVEDGIEGGLTIEEGIGHAVAAFEAGADALEISVGMLQTPKGKGAVRGPEGSGGEGYLLGLAAMVKERVKIPVIAVGGFRSRLVMQTVISGGQADMVAMARPLIREPGLPKKFLEGKEIADCISCSGCHKGEGPVHCARLGKGQV